MESNQVEVYQMSATTEPSNDQENVILRTLVGNPHRHKPLAEHAPPSDAISSAKLPASLYTLETRYRPIPPRVLPQSAHQSEVLVHSAEQRSSPRDQLMENENEVDHAEDETKVVRTDLIDSQVISTPVLYSLADQKNSLPPVEEAEREVIPSRMEHIPILYNLIANPRLQVQIQEPVKAPVIPPAPSEPAPSLYSIIGNPAQASLNTETPPESNKVPKPIPPPPPTPAPKPSEVMMYTLVGQPKVPTKTTLPHKANSFDASATKPNDIATLYTLVSKPRSPGSDKLNDRSKESARKKSPPPVVIPLRLSRSLERKAAKQPLAPIPPIKSKETRPKEPTIPKSETIFIPLRDEDRYPPRPKKQRTNLSDPLPEHLKHSPYLINQYEPQRFRDYHSPYAYVPQKNQQQRKSKTIILPPLRPLPSERKSRGGPNSSSDSKHTNSTTTPHSLERYPVKTHQRSRMWDYEYHMYSDGDDDYPANINHKRRRYRRFRPRQPWVPVW